jgi:hypothetical protein
MIDRVVPFETFRRDIEAVVLTPMTPALSIRRRDSEDWRKRQAT